MDVLVVTCLGIQIRVYLQDAAGGDLGAALTAGGEGGPRDVEEGQVRNRGEDDSTLILCARLALPLLTSQAGSRNPVSSCLSLSPPPFSSLVLKTQVDALSKKDNRWYAGRVAKVCLSSDTFIVKFDGYAESHNEAYSRDPSNEDVMPYRSHTGKPKQAKRVRPQVTN